MEDRRIAAAALRRVDGFAELEQRRLGEIPLQVHPAQRVGGVRVVRIVSPGGLRPAERGLKIPAVFGEKIRQVVGGGHLFRVELERALPLLRQRLAACLATEDAQEGLRAFLEKREPEWKGR